MIPSCLQPHVKDQIQTYCHLYLKLAPRMAWPDVSSRHKIFTTDEVESGFGADDNLSEERHWRMLGCGGVEYYAAYGRGCG